MEYVELKSGGGVSQRFWMLRLLLASFVALALALPLLALLPEDSFSGEAEQDDLPAVELLR
jgi:hypothetical protein